MNDLADDLASLVRGLDPGAPALIGGDGDVVTWGSLTALARRQQGQRMRTVVETRGAAQASVVAVLSALASGDVVTMPHPRWPTSMASEALARAGAGRPVPTSWPMGSATLLFSSGSTGRPKAVLHTLRAHVESARGAAARVPFGPGDRWLLSLPLCHVGGLAILMRALVGGAAVALPNVGRVVDDVVAQRPTHLSVVTVQLRDILASADATAALRANAKAILVGGGPVSQALMARARGAGLPVRQTWGLTELASQVCTSDVDDDDTCGLPLPGRIVEVDATGELLAGGDTLMAGVVDGDVLTPPPPLLPTGDVGVRTPRGFCVLGRTDGMFISGGENIHPEAVERALGDHEIVVVCVGLADDRYGARPFVFYDAPALDDDDAVNRLRARAERSLPRFMHPRALARLPNTTATKPSRRELAALAEAFAYATGDERTSGAFVEASSTLGG